jgi:hypothetical protein
VTHEEFVAGYASGAIRVRVDRERAARLMSARLLLPFFLLPFFGLAVGLALTGYVFTGIAVFVLVFAFRYAVRASSHGLVLSRALRDPPFFRDALAAGVLLLE